MKKILFPLILLWISSPSHADSGDTTFTMAIGLRNLSPRSGEKGQPKAVLAPGQNKDDMNNFNLNFSLEMDYSFRLKGRAGLCVRYLGNFSAVRPTSSFGVGLSYGKFKFGILHGVVAIQEADASTYRSLSLNFTTAKISGAFIEVCHPKYEARGRIELSNKLKNCAYYFDSFAPLISSNSLLPKYYTALGGGVFAETTTGYGLQVGVKLSSLRILYGVTRLTKADSNELSGFRSKFLYLYLVF